jgi:hypothetical protein
VGNVPVVAVDPLLIGKKPKFPLKVKAEVLIATAAVGGAQSPFATLHMRPHPVALSLLSILPEESVCTPPWPEVTVIGEGLAGKTTPKQFGRHPPEAMAILESPVVPAGSVYIVRSLAVVLLTPLTR